VDLPDRTEAIRYQIFTITTPAAGAEFSFTNTRGNLLRIDSIAFQLVTSAVVANRSVSLACTDGTNAWWRSPASGVQAASLTQRYAAFPGASPGTTGTIVQVVQLPDEGLHLHPGFVLSSLTGLIDAGDQYSAILFRAQELPLGPYVRVEPSVPVSGEEW
jgi:hypothetical protein